MSRYSATTVAGTWLLKNVSEQLEQGEDDDQHEECGENHPEVHEEIAQHVVVEQCGESGAKDAAASGGALEGVFAASAGDQGLGAGWIALPERAERG